MRRWLENPYHQYFCGEEYFCHELPIDPSSLCRFRKRIGEKDSELILQVTVQVGLISGAVKARSPERVTVDTTVQGKALAYPIDARLFNRSRERLVRLEHVGLPLLIKRLVSNILPSETFAPTRKPLLQPSRSTFLRIHTASPNRIERL